MTITPPQIRAARALLNWSGTDLSSRLGMSPTTISMIENGKNPGTIGTLKAIEAEFIKAGILFGEHDGVSMRHTEIFELKGREGLRALMDLIYEACQKDPLNAVRVNNLRMNEISLLLGDFAAENRQRFAEIAGMVKWKILLHPGDLHIEKPKSFDTRYLSGNDFGKVGQYCFGDSIAIVFMEEECRITVIDNANLHESWRITFDQMWQNATKFEGA